MSELPQILGILAEEVGADKALAIGRRLAGTEHKFPALSTLDRIGRDLRIREMAGAGWPHCQLGERFGLSSRQVRRILKKNA